MILARFVLNGQPPKGTAQHKKARVIPYRGQDGKQRYMLQFYDTGDIKKARKTFQNAFKSQFAGDTIRHPCEVVMRFYYHTQAKAKNGKPKETAPDTDNLSKIPLDALVSSGVLEDDKLVAVERIEKWWTYGEGRVEIEIRTLP